MTDPYITISGIEDEDFTNYKKPSMFVSFPKCTFKCEKESGTSCCQNNKLINARHIEITPQQIVERYLKNSITSAFVFGGLEPMDSFDDVSLLVETIRAFTDDDIVIYTGYYEYEIQNNIAVLGRYANIIVKFGRYIPHKKETYDELLGVTLASDNQYSKIIGVNMETETIKYLIRELETWGVEAPHIQTISNDYPYLWNYLKVSDKMRFSDDISLIEEIGNKLMKDPHCPCIIVKNENTICPCKACREFQHCHCGMFIPKGERTNG